MYTKVRITNLVPISRRHPTISSTARHAILFEARDRESQVRCQLPVNLAPSLSTKRRWTAELTFLPPTTYLLVTSFAVFSWSLIVLFLATHHYLVVLNTDFIPKSIPGRALSHYLFANCSFVFHKILSFYATNKSLSSSLANQFRVLGHTQQGIELTRQWPSAWPSGLITSLR